MKLLLCAIILFLSSTTCTYAEFKPWQSDVQVADELIDNKVKRKRINLEVTNGVQGGAFFMVRFFQIVISPQDGKNCRHNPVCSVYCRHAVKKHGALLGSFLAGDRLLRCNPFYPPEKLDVPERIFNK